MAVNSSVSSVQYNGNGTTTVFAYTFEVFDDDDLVVNLVNSTTGAATLQVRGTHYEVNGVGLDAGGNVTFTTAPASGYVVDIRTDMDLTQPTVFRNQGAFLPSSHEQAMDRIVREIIQVNRRADLAVRLPDLYDAAGAVNWDTLLSLANRKGKYFGYFNATTGAPELFTSIGATTLSQSVIGGFLYPQTAAELAAGVTPTNYYREPGDVVRYGAVGDGVTDDTAALQRAISACWAGSYTMLFPAGVFLVTGLTHDVAPADRDKVLRIRGAGYGEPFASVLTPASGTIIRRTTNGPVFLAQSTGTSTQSTGTIDIEGVFFDGDTTDAVVRFEQFYGISRFVGNVIFQDGAGNGLQVDYGATGIIERNYVLNGDAFTLGLGAARTGIGIYIRNASDAGLQSVEHCTSRGWLTAYQIGDASGFRIYNAAIRHCECSVVRNGIILTSDARSTNVRDNYMEGGDGGTGVLDQGDYNRIEGNLIFSGFATGIDLTAATKGNVCTDNTVAAGSVASSKLIRVSDSGNGKVVSNNHLSFGGSGGSIAGVVGIVIAGTAPVLDLSGNTFDPAGAWTGGAGTKKIDDTSTSGGVIGVSVSEDTAGYSFPMLSRGVISFGEGPTLADAAVTANTLAFGAAGYFVVTCAGAQTITALDGPDNPDCRVVTFRTTNSNATFTDSVNLQTAGGATFAGPGIIQFLIDSGVAYELGRTVL